MLPCLRSNTASQISILDIAYLRPFKCICLLAQKTCGLTAAKDIPVFVTEEMRTLSVASGQGQGSAVEALRKILKQKEMCAAVVGVPDIRIPFSSI